MVDKISSAIHAINMYHTFIKTVGVTFRARHYIIKADKGHELKSIITQSQLFLQTSQY